MLSDFSGAEVRLPQGGFCGAWALLWFCCLCEVICRYGSESSHSLLEGDRDVFALPTGQVTPCPEASASGTKRSQTWAPAATPLSQEQHPRSTGGAQACSSCSPEPSLGEGDSSSVSTLQVPERKLLHPWDSEPRRGLDRVCATWEGRRGTHSSLAA